MRNVPNFLNIELAMKFWPVKEEFDPERDKEIQRKYEDRASLSFEERLSLFWRIDSYGNESPELKEIQMATSCAGLGGFMFGFTSKSKDTMEKFVIDNKHEMFKSPREAQHILRKDMFLHGGIHAMRLLTKYGIMTFCFTFATQIMNLYCNDVTVSGHAACGFVLGGCYKLISGPKAMLSAGILGSALGSVHALTRKSVFWLEDTDYQGYLLKEYEKKTNDDSRKLQQYKLENKTKRDTWIESNESNQETLPEERNAFMRTLVSAILWLTSK